MARPMLLQPSGPPSGTVRPWPMGSAAQQIRRLSWIGLALLAVVIYGTLGYMVLFGWSFFDAIYMTIMTMTTVGFREVNPLSTGGQIFTVTVIILGVGVALIGIALTAAVIAEGGAGRSDQEETDAETDR